MAWMAPPKPPLSAVESNYMSRPTVVPVSGWIAGWMSGARLSVEDLGWQWSMNRINNVRFMQPEACPIVRHPPAESVLIRIQLRELL